MPIAAADLVWYYTMGNTGAAGASTAAASLGGTRSTTVWAGGVLNDLFDDVSSAENATGDTEYRAVAVRNQHASISLTSSVAYFTDPAGGATMAIGLDPAAPGGESTTTVANENTAPAGVTFSTAATSDAAGLSIGTLAPGEHKVIWVRRVIAANTTATPSDGVTLSIAGDTT